MYKCTQFVNSPTRFSLNNGLKNIIDHVYSNLDKNKVTANVMTSDITDHLPVVVKISKIKKPVPKKKKTWIQDMKSFDSEDFLLDLHSKLDDIKDVLKTNSAEHAWNIFEKTYNTTVFFHAPMIDIHKRTEKIKTNPWMNKEIKNAITVKNRLFTKAMKKKKT